MSKAIVVLVFALDIVALRAPSLACRCYPSPVVLLSSHAFQVDSPATAGLRLPSKPSVVKVTVDANGAVVRAKVVRSSGDHAADAIALRMARGARYAPARKNCRRITSSYFYMEDWQKNAS